MALPTQMIGGLVSGLDTVNIIEQLMSIERQPINILENRKLEHQTTLEAYRGINSLFLEFRSKVNRVADQSLWNIKNTASTNESVLAATASEYAQTGTHTFKVGRLARTAQYMSAGFVDTSDSPVSPAQAGEIRIDSSLSRIDRSTRVSELNGGTGIYHGSIRITDKAGSSSVVDLSTAETVEDVINAINQADGVNVRASINRGTLPADPHLRIGDAITIDDLNGLGAGTLKIENYAGSTTATDLGIEKSISGATNSFTGDKIYYLSGRTSLDLLRDGLGINDGEAGEIQIDDNGTVTNVTLDDVTTVQGLVDATNAALIADGQTIRMEIGDRGITFVTASGLGTTISSVGADNTTAEDLGIAGVYAAAAFSGREIISDLDSVRADSITGKNGVGINASKGNPLQNLGDIGVKVNGGAAQQLDISHLDNQSSLADVIESLNRDARGLGLDLIFRVNDKGNGIAADNTGVDSYEFVEFAANTTASDLGLLNGVADAGETFDGGDLDRHYLSRATALDSLNNGTGVYMGTFRIANAAGATAEINIASAESLGDIINMINTAVTDVNARINDTGDGIILEQTGVDGGNGNILVEEVYGGSTAEDLGLLGAGTGGDVGFSTLDGSFEKVVSIDTNDTLFDVMNKIDASGARIQSSIINDGSPYTPHRLVITGKDSGRDGDFILDSDLSVFNFQQTTRGQDSLMLYGEGGGVVSPVMLTSSTNTNNSAVLGLSISMKTTSSSPVTITVSEDHETAMTTIEEMVASYNTLNELVTQLDTYDEETETPGILFSDSATRSLMRELSDLFFSTVEGADGNLMMFYDIGIKFDTTVNDSGKRQSVLDIDHSILSEKMRNDFESVKSLMTLTRDIARRDLNAGASSNMTPADVVPGTPYDLSNLINGNTNSTDFGESNGFQANGTIASGENSLTVNFGEPRDISRLIIHHPDSSALPAEDFALKDFKVEYYDTIRGQWDTLRDVTGNKNSVNYLSFRAPTKVSQVRITANSTNAADGKFRLIEIEAEEDEGLAGQMNRSVNSLADSVDGFFATQQESLLDKIEDIDLSMEKAEARLEMVELQYIRDFSAMESALSQLTAQGDYFTQQMDAWNNSKK